MPRLGKNLTKAQIWSMLTALTDDVTSISTQVTGLQKSVDDTAQLVGGYVRAAEDTDKWQAENMAVLSSKVPQHLVTIFDMAVSRLHSDRWTRSSVIARLVRAFIQRAPESDGEFRGWLDEMQPTAEAINPEYRDPYW